MSILRCLPNVGTRAGDWGGEKSKFLKLIVHRINNCDDDDIRLLIALDVFFREHGAETGHEARQATPTRQTSFSRCSSSSSSSFSAACGGGRKKKNTGKYNAADRRKLSLRLSVVVKQIILREGVEEEVIKLFPAPAMAVRGCSIAEVDHTLLGAGIYKAEGVLASDYGDFQNRALTLFNEQL